MTTDASHDHGGLDSAELVRYDRQLRLPQIGRAGQMRLKRSRVLVVGAGGLGSPAAMHLAAAGVGNLGVVDADRVDASNLQRQLLHGTADIGREKTDSAADRIRDINPLVQIERHSVRLTGDNAAGLIRGYDAVLGCVDNLATRSVINTVCVKLKIPNIFGAVSRFEGQASVFSHADGPCYRCFFRDPPDDGDLLHADKAILGTVPGIIGSIQANETIKILLGIGKPLSGRLLLFDALALTFRELRIRKDPGCPDCGTPRKG